MQMKVQLGKQFEFEAAHCLPGKEIYGKCAHLHGHTYKLTVKVAGDIQNVKIKLQELIDFAIKNRSMIDFVFNLDEGSKEEQLDNCKKMKLAGLNVIGIWHGNMPLDYIARFAEITDYIAVSFFVLGSNAIAALRNKDRFKYLDRIFDYLHNNGMSAIKIHALGTEQVALLTRYPFYSADSTGCKGEYAYKKAVEFDIRDQKFKRNRFTRTGEVKSAIGAIGNKAALYVGNGRKSWDCRILHTAREREKYQNYLTELWAKRGIIWPDD